MDRLLLVDGHNLLFRMFYGMPFPFQNQNGDDITGTVGFVGTVVKMIKYLKASDCLVVFDGENAREAREKENEKYKGNRALIDELDNPFTQLGYIKAVLDFLNISWIETDGFECDDYISILAKRNSGETFISSNDSDFFQLVENKIKVLKFNGKNTVIIDEKYVLNKFGVLPKDFCLFKALVGDKTDNIKGIAKVGPKTAQKIIFSVQNSIRDKYFELYNENQDLIKKNIELIKQPNMKFDNLVENKACKIDYLKLENFKPLKDINEITKQIIT